jgi:hypothetical protein
MFKKTGQSKQSPNGRKFAESGHPVVDNHDVDQIMVSR